MLFARRSQGCKREVRFNVQESDATLTYTSYSATRYEPAALAFLRQVTSHDISPE